MEKITDNQSEALGEAKRSLKPLYNIPNYSRLYLDNHHRLQRSYEGCKYYFLTFKPYDGTYEECFEWYQARALDATFNKLKPHCQLVSSDEGVRG